MSLRMRCLNKDLKNARAGDMWVSGRREFQVEGRACAKT